MFTGQKPKVMSVCLGEQHLQSLDAWVDDLRAAVKAVVDNPGMQLSGAAAVYGAASTAPDEVLDEILRSYNDIRTMVKKK